jgi:hypothetical protein
MAHHPSHALISILRFALIAITSGGINASEAGEAETRQAVESNARPELNLSLTPSRNWVTARQTRWNTSPLEAAVARSPKVSWYHEAVQASIDAVADCQKGDHPGGGLGLFSIATLRPAAPSDHCRKF